MSNYLQSNLLALAQNHLAIYIAAAQRVGVPWELLASIHYRESHLAAKAPPQGFYRLPIDTTLVPQLQTQYKLPNFGMAKSDLTTATLWLAAYIQHRVKIKSGSLLSLESSSSELEDAAFWYDNQAYPGATFSAYVWNDPQGGLNLRLITGQVDSKAGVIPVSRELKLRILMQDDHLPHTFPPIPSNTVIPPKPVPQTNPSTSGLGNPIAQTALKGLRQEINDIPLAPYYCAKFARTVIENALKKPAGWFYSKIVTRRSAGNTTSPWLPYAADIEESCKPWAIALDQIKPGDLVFRGDVSKPYGHIGIYVGNVDGIEHGIAENTANTKGKHYAGALYLTPMRLWGTPTLIARLPESVLK